MSIVQEVTSGMLAFNFNPPYDNHSLSPPQGQHWAPIIPSAYSDAGDRCSCL